MRICFIAISILFSFHAFAETSSSLKKEFLKRFPLKEGQYDTVVAADQTWDFCQDESLTVELHEVDGELVLTIGPRLVFPSLQAAQVNSEAEKGCTVHTVNKIANNTLEQTVTEACGQKIESNKIHVLQISGDILNYQFSVLGQTQTCKYKFAKEASK